MNTKTKTSTEQELCALASVQETWANRAKELNLKGKKKDADACAFMQGALAAMLGAEVISEEQAMHISLLFLAGYGVQYLEQTPTSD